MSQALTSQSVQATSPEDTTQPTIAEVVDRILTEVAAAGISWYTAEDAADLIESLAVIGVEVGESQEPFYLSQDFLDRHHFVMDIIMPDDHVRDGLDILPGSAYAGINTLTLTGRQITWEHTKAYDNAEDFCVVQAHVRALS